MLERKIRDSISDIPPLCNSPISVKGPLIRTHLKIHMLMLNRTLPGRTRAPAGNGSGPEHRLVPGEAPVLPNPRLNPNPQNTLSDGSL